MIYKFTYNFKGEFCKEIYTNEKLALNRMAFLLAAKIPFSIITISRRSNKIW